MSQSQTAVQLISTHLNSFGLGASNFPNAASAITNPEATALERGVAFSQLGLALVAFYPLTGSVALGVGTVVAGVSAASLSLNINNIAISALTEGVVHQSDVSAAASDLTGMIGAIGLGLAPVASSGSIVLLMAGSFATNGFDALADLDGNQNGKIDSGDIQFGNLMLWRDLNQDGTSQSNELFSLDSQGIASINVANTNQIANLSTGNQLAQLGTFTKTDGTTGVLGQVADVNLKQDTFYSEFVDHVTLTEQAKLLPNMHGSGMVRDLREAASLSPTLANLLESFKVSTTAMLNVDNWRWYEKYKLCCEH